MGWTSDQEIEGSPHCPYVRPNIDDICNDQETNDGVQHPSGVEAPHISGNSVSRHTTEACTDFLNSGHERVDQGHRPEHVCTELSSYTGVGGNPAGIVISGSGY
jgi:hypothetical protein